MSPKYPCIECSKPVKSNNKAIMCVACHNWIHLSCFKLDNDFFFQSTADWICNNCIFTELPFSNWIDQNEPTQTSSFPMMKSSFQYNDCETFQNLR